jgi:hypothetical protein
MLCAFPIVGFKQNEHSIPHAIVRWPLPVENIFIEENGKMITMFNKRIEDAWSLTKDIQDGIEKKMNIKLQIKNMMKTSKVERGQMWNLIPKNTNVRCSGVPNNFWNLFDQVEGRNHYFVSLVTYFGEAIVVEW